MKNRKEQKLLKIIRLLVVFFIVALVASGITAFPLQTELRVACIILDINTSLSPNNYTGFLYWISLVNQSIVDINIRYPFLAYGYDWLAFAHIVIAIAFIGVYLKPIRNIWVVYFGMIACIGVLPLAFICGTIRGIPLYWQLIDCSFGVFGIIPLYILRLYILKLKKEVNYFDQKY